MARTVMIVPSPVPDAQVRRMATARPSAPHVLEATPAPVPAPAAVRLPSADLTAEHVRQLREENRALRAELDRVRAG